MSRYAVLCLLLAVVVTVVLQGTEAYYGRHRGHRRGFGYNGFGYGGYGGYYGYPYGGIGYGLDYGYPYGGYGGYYGGYGSGLVFGK